LRREFRYMRNVTRMVGKHQLAVCALAR